MRTLFPLFIAVTAANADTLKSTDLAKLRNPATRDAEVARLSGDDPSDYKITRCLFLTAKQKGAAPPLHVLSIGREYQMKSFSLNGNYEVEKPEELFRTNTRTVSFSTEPSLNPVRDSLLLVFNSKGREVRPFGGNNYTDEGYFFDFDQDGILDRAESTNYGVKEAPKHSVRVFELESFEPKPRMLLQVIFNWHPDSASDENDWGFTCFDDNNDGFAEIAFGPASAVKPEEQRKFVFRWDAERKCYSAGDIPEHSHIRVMKPGETLGAIAKSGGLGYPLIKGASKPDDDEPAPPAAQAPYVFHSFKERTASDIAAFFKGKGHRNAFDPPEDASPNRLPENLWDLTPKEAALAIAEANRTPSHREKWQLVLDDRGGVAPPESGWLTHSWGSSGCYSYSSHFFTLRFGVPDPVLTVFGYNSIGAVGRNPLADQPARNARVIKLTEKEARFIVDTVFWLDRIRSFSPRKPDHLSGMRSSTADGFATVTLYPDHGQPRDIAHGTVWATSSISGNWLEEFNPTTFINLAELFIAEGLPKRLGDRWNVAPEIDYQNLATPTNVRLAPRVDDDARLQLVETYSAILKHHAKEPMPAAALETLIHAAGDESLTELRPALEELFAALPEENAEDREFAALEKRFANEPIGGLMEKEAPEPKKAYDRYMKLKDEREFLPAAVLRKPLADAIAQLRLAGNTAELTNAAASGAPDSRWALGQLRRVDPEVWAGVVASGFRKADVQNRRMILNTLTVGNPNEVKHLISDLSPAEGHDLIIEIAEYHQAHDVASLAKDIPVLMSMVRERKDDFIRRGQAMHSLAELDLTAGTRAEFLALLEKEIRNPQKGQYDMDTLEEAVRALTKVSPTAEHLETITKVPEIAYEAFEAGIEAILVMARERPDRDRLLADFIRLRLKKSKGMMDSIFLHALAFDLRELAPEIAAFASEGPDVMDGDGANYSGGKFKGPIGQRYHIAREITAIWSETDPVTLGRMWAFFVAAHSYHFSPGTPRSGFDQALVELASSRIRSIPAGQRRKAVDEAISRIDAPAYSSGGEEWLRKLGDDGEGGR